MALGFLSFDSLHEFLSVNDEDPIHCIEYALRNIADKVPVRSGGSRIGWFTLKHLVSAHVERDWSSRLRDCYGEDDLAFFMGARRERVMLAQGAFGYSGPMGIKERVEFEVRSKVLMCLVDGVGIESPRMTSAIKGLSVLKYSERKVLRESLITQIKKMRIMDAEYFDDVDESMRWKRLAGDELIAKALGADEGLERPDFGCESDASVRLYDFDPDFAELYDMHEHILSLITKCRSPRGRTQALLDEIDMGEVLISRLGVGNSLFYREKERLHAIRQDAWSRL